jgi:hypothetical protein
MVRIFLFAAILSLLSCKNTHTDSAGKIDITPGISDLYEIDVNASRCEWKLDSQSVRTTFNVPIPIGKFSVLEGVPAAADFVMDFQALSVGNDKPELALRKTLMLKDSSFLHCADFPVGRGIMTKIEKNAAGGDADHKLIMDVKIKDQIRPVQILTSLQISENEVRMSCKPTLINLMEWGIDHPSQASMQLMLVFKRIYPQQN